VPLRRLISPHPHFRLPEWSIVIQFPSRRTTFFIERALRLLSLVPGGGGIRQHRAVLVCLVIHCRQDTNVMGPPQRRKTRMECRDNLVPIP